jgi:hypothetical protein
MNKKFLKELVALAEKHGMEVSTSCCYCERTNLERGTGTDYILTFSEKEKSE